MVKKKNRSMKINAVMMTFKTLLSLIVPMITFPYVSRILQVDALGQYNFSTSIINYFILFAGLGINTYAIREGTKVRENRKEISNFVNEMFAINCISTAVAYVFLFCAILCIPKLQKYEILLFILSIQLLFNVYGRAWIYNIFEDFGFITIVQVIFQIISLVSLFLFVKGPEDLAKYAVINVFSATGANIFYGIHAKEYIDFGKVNLTSLKKHIKPILIIFSTSIATTIYVNLDMTMLGAMVGDRCVGLYSTSVKIYTIIKQIMVAVITVTVPRLTLFAGKEEFKDLFAKVFNMIFLMAMPAMVGLFVLSEEAIIAIAGNQYAAASLSLKWLSVALVCALLANLFGTSVLLPYNKEIIFLRATVTSAIVNVILNFLLISKFQQNGAAFTSAISQAVALLICYYHSRKYVSLKMVIRSSTCTIIGCLMILVTCLFIKQLGLGLILEIGSCVTVSVLLYVITQIILKNETFTQAMHSVLGWLKFKIRRNS